MVSDSIKLGVVGCARILPAHLRGLKALQDAELADFRITALCARQRADAEMFRQRGKGPPPRASVITKSLGDPLNAPHMYVSDLHDDVLPEVYTDWQEMLRTAEVDAVLVLTPVHLHHPVALDCIRAGKHVLVEKPFAITVRAGQRMVSEAAGEGVVLGVAENFRYRETARIQRWLVERGVIGQVQMWLSGGMGAPDWSPDVIVAKTPWRHRRLKAGGGPAIDGGVHLFDQIRYLCGEVDEVSALTAQLEPRRVIRDAQGRVVQAVENEVEDAYFAHLKFVSGAVGTILGGVAGHGEPTRLEGGAVVYGTLGCLKGGELVLDDGQRRSTRELFAEEAEPALKEKWFPREVRDSFALELLAFLRAIGGKEAIETSGEEGVRDLACAYAILESSALGRPVKVAEVLSGQVDAYQGEINAHYEL
jgi:predicted dehydrogenase